MVAQTRRGLFAIALGAVIMLTGFSGCGDPDESGKIPLTTSSAEAKKFYLQGRELQEKLRAQESLVYFRKAVEADSNFAMAYLNLAFAQPTAKGFFESYYKATSLLGDVSEGERLWILGFEAGVNGETEKQGNYYRRLVKAYPDDERAHALLGNYYFGRQDYSKAIESYENAKAINPELSQIYNQLGYSYRALNKYDSAELAFQQYVELIPNDPNPYDSYAELLMKMGRFEESIEKYRTALEVNPKFVFSHVGIATNYVLLDQHDKAREQLEQMYEGAVNDAQRRTALQAMAMTYVDQGNYDKALELTQEMYTIAAATDDKPTMSGDMQLMGTLLLETGQYEAATDKFEMAITYIDSSEVSTEIKQANRQGLHYNLGRVAVETGRFDTAREHLKKYMERAQQAANPFQIRQGHQLAGIIAMAEGDYQTARDEFLQANLQNPYNLYRIGQSYEREGDKQAALSWYKQAADFNQVNSLGYMMIRSKARAKVDTLSGGEA